MQTLSSILSDNTAYLNDKNYLWFQVDGITKVRKVYSHSGSSFVTINKVTYEVDTNNVEILSTNGVTAPYFN